MEFSTVTVLCATIVEIPKLTSASLAFEGLVSGPKGPVMCERIVLVLLPPFWDPFLLITEPVLLN